MSAIAFDTLKFAQTLRNKAKLTTEQAEGISEAFAEATGQQLVTKDYLDSKIESTKTDIIRWLVVTQLALGGFIFAALRLVK
jgi:hypothetical protein